MIFRNGTVINSKMLSVPESQILIKSVPQFIRSMMLYMPSLSDQMNSMTRTNHLSKIPSAEIQIIITRIEFTFVTTCYTQWMFSNTWVFCHSKDGPINEFWRHFPKIVQFLRFHVRSKGPHLKASSTFHILFYMIVFLYELDERFTLKTSILVWIKQVTEFWDRLDTRNEDLSSKNRSLSTQCSWDTKNYNH